MKEFRPGFRINVFDIIFILAVSAVSGYLYTKNFNLGVVTLIPAIMFFLFCNVFRVRRIPELIWTSIYIPLVIASFMVNIPLWTVAVFSFATGGTVILYELKQPGYHGIIWYKINPSLKDWWDANKDK